MRREVTRGELRYVVSAFVIVIIVIASVSLYFYTKQEEELSQYARALSEERARIAELSQEIEELASALVELLKIIEEITPPPPPPSIVDQIPFITRILLPGETWDVFLEEREYHPEGNRLDFSYKANASIVCTVSFGLDVVSEGRCEESDQNLKFSYKMQAEFKVVLENDSDFEIEVSVEITVAIDPDC